MIYYVRCGDGSFRLNHVFTIATRYKKRKYPDEFGEPSVIEEQRPINLRVDYIDFYSRAIEQVGWGCTCALEITGEVDFDIKDWAIGNEDEFMKAFVAEVEKDHDEHYRKFPKEILTFESSIVRA